MERAGMSAALDQRHDRLLRGGLAGSAIGGLATDKRLVGFNGLAGTAEMASGAFHRLADAVKQEPSALVGDAERAVQLVGREALLAAAEKRIGHEPFVQGDLRVFHDRADRDRERL